MNKFLSLFKAAPTRKNYADGADLFRVFCVAMIAWFHIWQQSWKNPNFMLFGVKVNLYPIVTCGYIFVDSMLLLSGFLLMLGMVNNRTGSARNFYIARIARIVPCYYLFLAFQGIIFIVTGTGFGSLSSGLTDILSHLTFMHTLFKSGYIGSKFNGVLWTLAVEVQFYLLFPYIGRAFRRKPVPVWFIMTAIAFLYRFCIAKCFSDISMYFNQLPAMLDVYANGMMAAVIWVKLSKLKPNTLRAWLATLLTAAAFIAIYYLAKDQRQMSDYPDIRQHQMDIRFPLSAAGAILLIASGRSIFLVRKLFSNRLTRFLSAISFNFYMWHQFTAVKLKELHIPPYTTEAPNVNSEAPWQTLYTIACFAIGLAVAALLTYTVEKPCAKFIKKRFSLDKAAQIRYNRKQPIKSGKTKG